MSTSRYNWNRTHPGLVSLQEAIEPVRRKVVTHAIYQEISSLENVCKWARLGPSAATASAMGIAWTLIMVWVSPVNW